jgi:hypothetical protein
MSDPHFFHKIYLAILQIGGIALVSLDILHMILESIHRFK